MAQSSVTDVPLALRSGMRLAKRHSPYGCYETLFEGSFDTSVLIYGGCVYNKNGVLFISGEQRSGENPFLKRDFEVRVRVTVPYGLNRGADDHARYHLHSIEVIDHRRSKATTSAFRKQLHEELPRSLGVILGCSLPRHDWEKDIYISGTDFAPAPQTPPGHEPFYPIYGPERSDDNPGAVVLHVLASENKLLELRCRLAHEITAPTLDQLIAAAVEPFFTALPWGGSYARAH